MCGICGVWEYGASEGSIESSLLTRMRDEMTHRGPDDAGELIFDERRGGFGFRRLSIIDLSAAGHQPMHGCDDRTWLVFNGEIYNHALMRADLEQRGHKYSSRTDSETILHLYEERGLDFIHEIEGDYAHRALGCEQRTTRPRARSHRRQAALLLSQRWPLHFCVGDQGDPATSGSHARHRRTSALSLSDVSHHARAHDALSRHSKTSGRSHADAQRATARSISSATGTRFRLNKRLAGTEEEQRAEILRLLRDSIRKRMMSDVPFGVFLSGGVDSSANVALMSEQMSRPVETFTVGFSDAEYLNELEPARRISRQFGTNHHEVIISEKEMHDFLPSMVFHQDEPIADPVCVPLYYVSKLARDSGTIVVQVGEGSDEIFSGYENYVRHLRIYENFWRHAEALPLSLRRAISNISRPALEATGRKRAAIELIRRLGADEPLFWGGVVVYDETFKPRVLSKQVRDRLNGLSSLRVVESYLKHIEQERPDADFLARMTYLELKLRLPELLLMRVDKITMATSVEARVPFLDHHLVEYALSLPRSLKVEGVSGKHILKRSLEEILPRDLLYERKRGFGAPVREWFREGLGGWFDEHLMNSTMRRRDLAGLRICESHVG